MCLPKPCPERNTIDASNALNAHLFLFNRVGNEDTYRSRIGNMSITSITPASVGHRLASFLGELAKSSQIGLVVYFFQLFGCEVAVPLC